MKELFRKIGSEYKSIFIFSLIGGFVLYSPIAYQSLWNPDSLSRSVFSKNLAWVSQARWGCQLWEDFIRSSYIMPMHSFWISIIFLSIIVVMVIDIFKIKSRLSQLLVVACIVSSLHQLSTMTYAYCGDEFTIAYFLAVSTAFFLCKIWDVENRTIINCAYAIICMIVCLAMYQAYLAVTVIILGTRFVIELFSEKEWKLCIQRLSLQMFSLVCSLVGYLISIRISLKVYNTTLSSYRGIDKMGLAISDIPGIIKETFYHFYLYYFKDYLFNNTFRGKKEIHIVIVLLILGLLLYLVKININKMNFVKCVLLIGCVILLPVGFNVVSFMTRSGVSFMMLPAIPYLYIILVILIEEASRERNMMRIFQVMKLPVILIVYTSILLINMLEVELRLDINKASSIANNIDVEIKAYEEYTKDTKVLVVGSYNKGNYERVYENVFYSQLGGTVSDFGQFWMGPNLGLSNMNCWNHLFMQYCGSSYIMCSQDEYDSIVASQEFSEMPIYPKEGSLRMIEDVLVVKLSDELY